MRDLIGALIIFGLTFGALVALPGCAVPVEEAVKCHRQGEKIGPLNMLPVTAQWSC